MQVGAAASRAAFGQHEGQHWSENPSASALRATNAAQAKQIEELKKKLKWALHLARTAQPRAHRQQHQRRPLRPAQPRIYARTLVSGSDCMNSRLVVIVSSDAGAPRAPP